MVDVVNPETRSRMMSGIQGRNTKPEILVRRILHASGYRFRLHRRDLPGAPDIVLPSRKVVVFVNGCFWHLHSGCRYAKVPATRREFWSAKLQSNIERDRRAIESLRAMDWRVLTVWECATRGTTSLDGLQNLMASWIEGSDPLGEIGGALTG